MSDDKYKIKLHARHAGLRKSAETSRAMEVEYVGIILKTERKAR